MNQPKPVFPANRHALYEQHGYSAAIRSGDLLFVSGQVGSREDGTPEPDFATQVERAFDNLKATLDAAGCTFADLVDVTTFHTDPENQFPDSPFLSSFPSLSNCISICLWITRTSCIFASNSGSRLSQ